MSTEQEETGDRIARNAAMLRLFKNEYRDSGDRHSDALFVKEGLELKDAELTALRQRLAAVERERDAYLAELTESGARPANEKRGIMILVNMIGEQKIRADKAESDLSASRTLAGRLRTGLSILKGTSPMVDEVVNNLLALTEAACAARPDTKEGKT
jgi:hypothetical protein